MEEKPHELVRALATAGYAARCIHAVSDLGLADHIDDEMVAVENLAASCGVQADPLDRVLRLLAAHGVFEHGAGGYGHTPASRLLRSDHPMSMRAYARMMGLPLAWGSLTELHHSLRTGSPGLDVVEPQGLWVYLQNRPQDADVFSRSMTAKAGADVAAVLAGYDFGHVRTVADIGGGRGHLLRAVLDAAPGARGFLFDLPEVIQAVRHDQERLTARAGDFFVDPLPSAEMYLIMQVLHDWNDEQCVAILRAVRRAAQPDSTLLVIENVLMDGPTEPRALIGDIVMLTVTGGRERTSAEYEALLERGGFRMSRVVGTRSTLRIIEAAVA